MKANPKKTEQKLNQLIDAWKRLDPTAEFAGYTVEAFEAQVDSSFASRAKLKEIRLDFAKWVMSRKESDEESMQEHYRVIHGIRSHAGHGKNSPILRACGYVMEMERESGLVRPANAETAWRNPGPDGVHTVSGFW